MNTPTLMTGGRRLALAIGTPIALLVIGWTGLTLVAWAGQGSYPVNLDLASRGSAVLVEADAGRISLGPGAADRIRVTGTARYALFRSQVTWRRTLSQLAVYSQCRQPTGPCSFDYRVTVPARTRVVISVRSGDLVAAGLAGPVTLRDKSGNVHASALSGSVEITSMSGAIFGIALSGPHVLVRDKSGDISITGLASRDVTVTDQSGDITVSFAAVPGHVRVSGVSGNITLILPHGSTAYRVSARTSSGQTTIGVPTNLSSPHVITVTDKSGDITVTQ